MSTTTELYDWLHGTATGGPNSDGRYPLTGSDGVTHLVYCPAAQATNPPAGDPEPVSVFADAAAASAAAAASSATAAAGSASSAAASATTATTKAGNATTSAASASTSATTANTKATAAAASATAAATSKTGADSSALAAADSATAAATSATNAGSSATAAASSASSAAATLADVQSTVTGILRFKGVWSASGGAYPSSPAKGDFWKISVAGTISGIVLNPGDQIYYNGSGWDTIDNTEQVTSVAGRIGAVVIATTDVSGLATALSLKLDASATAVAATKLATARTIAGQAFDGTTNISIAASDVGALAVGATAVAATKLATARNINGVAFDGTAGITIPNLGLTTSGLGQFAGTSSAQLLGVMSDGTGTGSLVFNTSPTFTGTVGAASISATGTITSASTVTGLQNFQSSTTSAFFGPTGAGIIALRPNGVGSATGQLTVAASGLMTTNGDVIVNGAMSSTGIAAATTFSMTGTSTGTGYLFFDRTSGITAWNMYSTAGLARLYSYVAGADVWSVTSAGNMTVVGSVTASNLSGTNTGDQNLAPYALLASPRLVASTAASLDVSDTAASRANAPGVTVSGAGAGVGGTLVFGSSTFNYAYIKGYFTNGTSNGVGKLAFGTRSAIGDTSMTNKLIIHETGNVEVTTGGLTVTAGGATVTAGDLTMTVGSLLVGTGNLQLGAAVATSATDVSKHIALYGTTYGINVTSNTINYVAGGGFHNFINSAGAGGAITAATITTTGIATANGQELGFRRVPITAQNANYTAVADDSGRCRSKTGTTAWTYTINNSVFAAGDVLTLTNQGATGNITIAAGSGVTLRLGGTATTGSRTVAPFGVANIYMQSATVGIVTGAGVS